MFVAKTFEPSSELLMISILRIESDFSAQKHLSQHNETNYQLASFRMNYIVAHNSIELYTPTENEKWHFAVVLPVVCQIDIHVNIKVNNQFVISFADSLSKFIGISNKNHLSCRTFILSVIFIAMAISFNFLYVLKMVIRLWIYLHESSKCHIHFG